MKDNTYVRWFENLGSDDVGVAGGKYASLGEMIRTLKEEGISVPDGFATTADAYWKYLEENDLPDKIRARLQALEQEEEPLEKVGKSIRGFFKEARFPKEISEKITAAYRELSKKYGEQEGNGSKVDVAVRSSATAEDLPEASFAGQQET